MDFSKAVAEYKKLLAMKAAMELELPSFEKAVQNFKKSASKDLLDQLYQVEPVVPVEENSVTEPEKEPIEKSIENNIPKHVEKPIEKIVPKADNDDPLLPKMIHDSDSENHSRIFPIQGLQKNFIYGNFVKINEEVHLQISFDKLRQILVRK